MFTLTISLDSTALHIVALDMLVLFSYILYLNHKKRKIAKSVQHITDFITEYFMHTGAEVQVTCFKLESDKHFVTLIQSKPLKRFRFSNILESNLIAHIYEKTGNVVEKIYWRFPVEIRDEAIVTEAHNTGSAIVESDDMYFVDVQAVAEANGNGAYKVSEATWDEFKGRDDETK